MAFYSNGNSYERYQANGIVATMLPCLKKIYKDDSEGLHEAMERTSELFLSLIHIDVYKRQEMVQADA